MENSKSTKPKKQDASREFKHRIKVEKRRNWLRNVLLTCTILLITIVTIIMLLRILSRNKTIPRYIFLREEKLERLVDCEALIVRDEEIVKSPSDGRFLADYPQGKRLANGEIFGRVVDSGASSRIAEVAKAESDLAARRYELLETPIGADARRIAEQQDVEIHRLMSRYYNLDPLQDENKISVLASALKLSLQQRGETLAEIDFKDREYQQAKENYLNLKSLLDSVSRTVTAPVSGVLSFAIDGQEELKIEDLLEQDSRELYETWRKIRAEQNGSEVQNVEADQEICKIIHGVRQYFLITLPSGSKDQIEATGYLTAKIDAFGIEITRLKPIRIEESREGTILIVETGNGIAQLAGQRRVKLSLELASMTGLKLPRQALISFRPGTPEAKVKIVQEGFVREVGIRVIDFNENYALVEKSEQPEYSDIEIGPATMLVVNPEAVNDGDSIDDLK
ncbi:MAG: HlyD family efflux transporter periplasmic adaptor subunit [Eubacteriales bacterium]|nr:HlyD family efflux transporter periplasmic adaptor subunit [Eubacteriales bacterium]